MNKNIIHKLLMQLAKMLLCLFALTGLSCERDTFYINDIQPGEPVDILLGFELPLKDQVAVTRTLTDKEEHQINDFYLLIFNEAQEKIFGKYYTLEELQGKISYEGGTWSSVSDHIDDMKQANSTHGYVLAKAVTSTCYIFGFANIGSDNEEDMAADPKLEGVAVKENLKEGLQSTRYKLDHLRTLDQLYEVQMDAISGAKTDILIRDTPNLLYSGAWRAYGSDLETNKELNGKVDIGSLITADPTINNDGNIDLRKKGMIYLRTLTSHINFNIKINSDVFTAFEPEYWQVVNLPQRVYLMDQGDKTPVKKAEIEFMESTEMTNNMVHDNGMFTFDFWMFENHKKARKASDLTNTLSYSVVTSNYVSSANTSNSEFKNQYLYVAAPDENGKLDVIVDEDDNPENDIIGYYRHHFGNELNQWEVTEGSNTPLPKLKTIYGYGAAIEKQEADYGLTKGTVDENNEEAIQQFLYSKREFQVKRRSVNTSVWNRAGDYYPNDEGYGPWASATDEIKNNYLKMKYSSKKFVYVDDKATYVIIKGRLRMKKTTDEGFNLVNYGSSKDGDYLTSKTDTYHDGYADVTYTIHLGNINESIDDFNCLRNTEYNYTVTINGINSIYTTVESSSDNGSGSQYRVKKQPGADGMLNLARGTVYNTDAHFCQFNMMLTKASLNNFYFEMHTPWRTYSTEEIKTDITAGYSSTEGTPGYENYLAKYGNNPDFNWFKFSPNDDQAGMFDEESTYTSNETTYKQTRRTTKYNSTVMWNLFTFTETMIVLEQASAAAAPKADETSDAADTRMANLLASTFECSVGGKTYHGDKALPFLLDEVKYEVSQAVYDNAVNNNNSYQTCTEEDGKYYITEDYVKYFKAHCSLTDEEKDQVTHIRRMFYTVYLDEYYYHTQPYGVTSWTNPYWKHFANQTSRFVNFGYHSTGEASSVNGYILSPDKQSGVMLTQLTVVQPSIQTFYSQDNAAANSVAIGLEHVNETHDPRWTDLGDWTGHEISTTKADGVNNYYSYNGWLNTINYVNQDITGQTGGTTLWDYYVSDLTYDSHNGLQNNVAMRLSGNTWNNDMRKRTGGSRNDNEENPYLAGAIRMCLNRNRDENGNGKIDEEELKWFLPTARQYELANLGHFSLQDPLLEYNDYVLADGSQRLPLKSVEDKELWEFRYVASDYQMLAAEQMTNSPDYTGANWVTGPYNMRCMRNLGGETERNGDGSTKTNKSSDSQSLVFAYDSGEKVFTVNLFDSRSMRSIYYDAEELPEHYLFSATNLPYRKFKVAKSPLTVNKSGYTTFKDLIEQSRPCQQYSEDMGGNDLGSWRVPNQAELALMVMQLRSYNESKGSNMVEEESNPWFFLEKGNADTNFLTGTSWNFTGYWGRMITGNHDSEGWGMHMTPAKPNYNNIVNGNYTTFTPSTLDGKNYYVRCVKDIMN